MVLQNDEYSIEAPCIHVMHDGRTSCLVRMNIEFCCWKKAACMQKSRQKAGHFDGESERDDSWFERDSNSLLREIYIKKKKTQEIITEELPRWFSSPHQPNTMYVTCIIMHDDLQLTHSPLLLASIIIPWHRATYKLLLLWIRENFHWTCRKKQDKNKYSYKSNPIKAILLLYLNWIEL